MTDPHLGADITLRGAAGRCPQTIMGYVVQNSGRHQIALAALSDAVFGLSNVPIELQRRIVNDAIRGWCHQDHPVAGYRL